MESMVGIAEQRDKSCEGLCLTETGKSASNEMYEEISSSITLKEIEITSSSKTTTISKIKSDKSIMLSDYQFEKPFNFLRLNIGFIRVFVADIYGKCEGHLFAARLFDKMSNRNVGPRVCVDSTLLELSEQQRSLCWNARPNSSSVVDLFLMFVYSKFSATGDVLVYKALIDIHDKCGRVGDAQFVFKKLSEKFTIRWNLAIGYALYGCSSPLCLTAKQPNLEIFQIRDVVGDTGLDVISQHCKKEMKLGIAQGCFTRVKIVNTVMVREEIERVEAQIGTCMREKILGMLTESRSEAKTSASARLIVWDPGRRDEEINFIEEFMNVDSIKNVEREETGNSLTLISAL
ncbi:hypothetical protein K7X08_023073 [Anisodus acutangulus]|uniref:Pentatricopeptide repeat-containing protein n=1 Tax=Anisodus acutangulus TaxID=402998 RepID=A0A9Q1MDL7_9SOLA|nr:hypothetical protein K7X08_023073 [Anisodus acutangulus]